MKTTVVSRIVVCPMCFEKRIYGPLEWGICGECKQATIGKIVGRVQ